jgi:hypothetical protein
MRDLEYNLAANYGSGSLLIMDGTLFGQDKHLSERLVEKGIVFCAVVKNPVSKIMQSWYGDAFTEYGYEEAAGDAIAYNDLLYPGNSFSDDFRRNAIVDIQDIHLLQVASARNNRAKNRDPRRIRLHV